MSTTAGASATHERAAALAGLAPDTPEIVIDLDIVRANIDRAAALARELRSGCSRRACATSFAMMEVIPIRGVAPRSLSRARGSTSGVTSSSSTEVSCADLWRLDNAPSFGMITG